MSEVPLYVAADSGQAAGMRGWGDPAGYRGSSLIRSTPPVGPCSSLMPRTYGDPSGVGVSYERGTPAGLTSDLQGWGSELTSGIRGCQNVNFKSEIG